MGHLLSFSNNFRNDLIFTVSLYLLFQCLLLNVTYCPPSEMDFSKGKSLVSFGINSCIAPSEVTFFSSPILLKQKINCHQPFCFQYIIIFFVTGCSCVQLTWLETTRCSSCASMQLSIILFKRSYFVFVCL